MSDYRPEELEKIIAEGGTLRLMEDGSAGYILTSDGDLRNVFRIQGSPPGIGARAVIEAISRGAKTLDCLGDGLGFFYARFGFVATKAILWDDAQAPRNWNYEKNDRPNVFFMEYRGETRDAAEIEQRARAGFYPPFEHPGFDVDQLAKCGEKLRYGDSAMNDETRPAPFTREELERRGYGADSLDLEWLNEEWESYQEYLIRTYGPEEGRKKALSGPERTAFLAAAWLFG